MDIGSGPNWIFEGSFSCRRRFIPATLSVRLSKKCSIAFFQGGGSLLTAIRFPFLFFGLFPKTTLMFEYQHISKWPCSVRSDGVGGFSILDATMLIQVHVVCIRLGGSRICFTTVNYVTCFILNSAPYFHISMISPQKTTHTPLPHCVCANFTTIVT